MSGHRVENLEYGSFLERSVRALGRRIADGDPEDLELLRRVDEMVAHAKLAAVAGLREQGHAWDRIASALGISRQAAWEWFRNHSL